ncbi:hypothetical protein E3N88_04443 [Mikania micrantha]|uniref:Uncharacterized protein n=1 Tax=Mikania micrantha TaxID=192012 RepID=A0A5N6PUG4_9ASTR|nr:hypothetical protein E3N88_04443 [Mikania micrantha]
MTPRHGRFLPISNCTVKLASNRTRNSTEAVDHLQFNFRSPDARKTRNTMHQPHKRSRSSPTQKYEAAPAIRNQNRFHPGSAEIGIKFDSSRLPLQYMATSRPAISPVGGVTGVQQYPPVDPSAAKASSQFATCRRFRVLFRGIKLRDKCRYKWSDQGFCRHRRALPYERSKGFIVGLPEEHLPVLFGEVDEIREDELRKGTKAEARSSSSSPRLSTLSTTTWCPFLFFFSPGMECVGKVGCHGLLQLTVPWPELNQTVGCFCVVEARRRRVAAPAHFHAQARHSGMHMSVLTQLQIKGKKGWMMEFLLARKGSAGGAGSLE